MLSCLWDGAYKRTLAANRKEKPMIGPSRFPVTDSVVIYHMSDGI